jgi:hypothetical protein
MLLLILALCAQPESHAQVTTTPLTRAEFEAHLRAPKPAKNPKNFTPDFTFTNLTAHRQWTGTTKGVLEIAAKADLALPATFPDYYYVWAVDVRRGWDPQNPEIAWQWTYTDQWFTVRSGTHLTPEFKQTLKMPPGQYLVRLMLNEVKWDADDVPWNLGPARLSSFRATVP